MKHERARLAGQKPSALLPFGPWLRWGWHGLFVPGHTANQFVRFCLVGASGVVVNYAVMWALFRLGDVPYVLASVGAFMVANLNNYYLNKSFTFKDQVRGWGPMGIQYLKFLGITLPGLAINEAVLVGLVHFWAMDPVLANLVGVLVATFSNFVGNKFFTFRVKPPR